MVQAWNVNYYDLKLKSQVEVCRILALVPRPRSVTHETLPVDPTQNLISILAWKYSIWTSNVPITERRLCTDSSLTTSALVDNHRKMYLLTHLSVGFIACPMSASLSNHQKKMLAFTRSVPYCIYAFAYVCICVFIYIYVFVCYIQTLYCFKIRYTLGISCLAVSNLNILYDL